MDLEKSQVLQQDPDLLFWSNADQEISIAISLYLICMANRNNRSGQIHSSNSSTLNTGL